MSSSVKHTLEHLEEQQKQRLLKKKKKEENEKAEMVVKNVCKCSVEDQYDNFDGVEDELDLKVISFSSYLKFQNPFLPTPIFNTNLTIFVKY